MYLNVEFELNLYLHAYVSDDIIITKINGAEKVECGNTTRFNVVVKQTKPSKWSVNCQKYRNDSTELIDKGSLKYMEGKNHALPSGNQIEIFAKP